MADRYLRDPMTLDEERRAALNGPELSDHGRMIRDVTPGMFRPFLHHRLEATAYTGNEILDRYAGAILSGDCGNER